MHDRRMKKHKTFKLIFFAILIICIRLSLEMTILQDTSNQPSAKTAPLASQQSLSLAAIARTPLQSTQWYLERLHVPEAHDVIRKKLGARPGEGLTVAVVDTGVDFDHPDLKDRLLPGLNLITPGKPPQDDHGHGTVVAGVIVGQGTYDQTTGKSQGVAGIAPGAKLIPIKALDSLGRGDSRTVAEGIMAAVSQGADVIVLSLTDPVYSTQMVEALKEAEAKGVVVIAAAGNDASRTHYPAAYPTVVGVGALDKNDRPTYYTNYGDGVDLVAYGEGIYTTVLRNGLSSDKFYATESGTSLAAPQVAGIALLVKQMDPTRSALDIRDILRATAEPVPDSSRGVTGFGRVDALKAVMSSSVPPLLKGNTTQSKSAFLALDKDVRLSLSPGEARWYAFDPPYAGTITFSQAGLKSGTEIRMEQVDDRGKVLNTQYLKGGSDGKNITFAVSKARAYFRLTLVTPAQSSSQALFILKPRFTIYTSPYAASSTPDKAYPIEETMPLSVAQPLIGTLPHDREKAWFRYTAPVSGRLTIYAESDDPSLDLVLYVQKGKDLKRIDENGPTIGLLYEETVIDVRQGETILIGLENFTQVGVNAEYRLGLRLDPPDREAKTGGSALSDERPLRPELAPFLQLGTVWYSYFERPDERLYVWLDVPKDVYIEFAWSELRPNATLTLKLQKKGAEQKQSGDIERRIIVGDRGNGRMVLSLTSGMYSVLFSVSEVERQFFTFTARQIDSPFTDIRTHWARPSIEAMFQAGLISGYPDGRFRPDQPVTRAELIVMLTGRLNAPLSERPSEFIFKDVPVNHWAAAQLQTAYELDLMRGYPDRTLRPDAFVTRSELVNILARALKQTPDSGFTKQSGDPSALASLFSDVSKEAWYANDLSIIASLHYLSGYPDGTFRPQGMATRAEVMTLINKIWPVR